MQQVRAALDHAVELTGYGSGRGGPGLGGVEVPRIRSHLSQHGRDPIGPTLVLYPGVGSPTPADKLLPMTSNRRRGASKSNAAAVVSERRSGSDSSVISGIGMVVYFGSDCD
ncbi:hypothetical protein [Nocardia sp. NPDC047654]|uniref:hypothetical protein n=1 Tax=Nocardia sp. NPDC047654 TaxID=3364314 RepID=UPI0037237F38